jgi:putative phosphoesterase
LKTIGIISDTHGLMRREALEALRDSDVVVHAGDVGSPDVLQALRRLAPVFAVRGNVDRDPWATALPATQIVEVDGREIYVLHDLEALNLDPAAAGFHAVVFGHSHQPSMTTKGGVLYVNPGSAGPRRFRLPVSVAKLKIGPGDPPAEIIHLRV